MCSLSSSSSSPTATPVLNHDRLAELTVILGQEALIDLLQTLGNGFGPALQEIGEALAAANLDRLARAAHSIKGAAENFGFVAVAEVAHRIEKAAMTGSPAKDAETLLRGAVIEARRHIAVWPRSPDDAELELSFAS